MLLSARPYRDMGAPPLPALPVQPARHFPQWSRTAILTLSSVDDDGVQDEEVKKSPPEPAGSGFIISGDPVARVAHLEHSVRFLQEQHRLMLNGLHTEIEALRERNRDLQFQLIFNKEAKEAKEAKESSPKATSPINEENVENSEEVKLKSEVSRLEKEVAAVRSEAQAADAHVVQLRQLVKVQAEKIRELEIIPKCVHCEDNAAGTGTGGEDNAESRAELRARLADAEKLVRRLRAEAERRRREVVAAAAVASGGAGGAVTNLLFDGAAARHAHVRPDRLPLLAPAWPRTDLLLDTLLLQCMKNSLHASLRATGLDAYGFQNNYHFPPVHHTPDFWREPIREDLAASRGRCSRRPVVLPELAGQQVHRSTVYANNHTSRPRANGYDKNKKPQQTSNEVTNGSPEQEQPESRLSPNQTFLPNIHSNVDPNVTYPELKIVVTKMIPHGNVAVSTHGAAGAAGEAGRARARRPHRKHAADHT